MPKLKQFSKPGIVGVIICLLLILSATIKLGDLIEDDLLRDSVRSVISIVSMCFGVHLIRSTAKLYDVHVWSIRSLITLICMPVFDLLVTLTSLLSVSAGMTVFKSIALFFSNTLAGMIVMVAFSMPMFILYYFIYLFRKFCDSKKIRTMTIILAVVCAVNCVMQLFDKGILPMMKRLGMNASEKLISFMSYSAEVSIVVDLVALVGFIIFQIVVTKQLRVNTERKNAEIVIVEAHADDDIASGVESDNEE